MQPTVLCDQSIGIKQLANAMLSKFALLSTLRISKEPLISLNEFEQVVNIWAKKYSYLSESDVDLIIEKGVAGEFEKYRSHKSSVFNGRCIFLFTDAYLLELFKREVRGETPALVWEALQRGQALDHKSQYQFEQWISQKFINRERV